MRRPQLKDLSTKNCSTKDLKVQNKIMMSAEKKKEDSQAISPTNMTKHNSFRNKNQVTSQTAQTTQNKFISQK